MNHAPAIPSMRSSEVIPYSGTSASTVGVPQRLGKALLGWIQEPDVRLAFYATSVTSPLNVEDFVEQCRALRITRDQTFGLPSSPPDVAALPAALESQAAALRATDQFKTTYEPFGAQLAVVRLADLAVPQWWVNIQAPGLGVAASDRWLRFGGRCGAAWWLSVVSGMMAGCDRWAGGGAVR